jgi:hypothetical protein
MINVRIRFYCAIGFIISFFLFSCKQATNSENKVNYYFDLKKYFEQEAARLQKDNPVVIKNVMLNGETESKQAAIGDWKNEFLTFTEADINKSAFAGKYVADTVFENSVVKKISYTATDKKLSTKLLEVTFDAATQLPEAISINIETKNTLYHSAQTLHYSKGHSYSVAGNQKIKFLNADEFKVEVKF